MTLLSVIQWTLIIIFKMLVFFYFLIKKNLITTFLVYCSTLQSSRTTKTGSYFWLFFYSFWCIHWSSTWACCQFVLRRCSSFFLMWYLATFHLALKIFFYNFVFFRMVSFIRMLFSMKQSILLKMNQLSILRRKLLCKKIKNITLNFSGFLYIVLAGLVVLVLLVGQHLLSKVWALFKIINTFFLILVVWFFNMKKNLFYINISIF